jgi:drug/metabolite transporter (DMT)-like permease
MTSGQGPNQPGGEYGPPQGWNPPPGQDPYGQPYPGYGPAPSAPTGQGAPPAMERPITVRAGIGAYVASLLVGLISAVAMLADLDSYVDRAVAAAAGNPDLTEEVIRGSITLGIVVGLIFLALEVMFLWFAWNGRNWARIVLWVLGGLGVAFGLLGLAQDNGQTGFSTSMGVFQLLFTAAAIVLLALKPSNDWYRYRSWQRAAGQG